MKRTVSSVCLRALLALAILVVACKRSPIRPAPSAAESARSAVSSSPRGSAPVAAVAPPRCADWTVNDRGAQASLEHWCQQFGPCPASLQQAVARVAGRFPTIEARGNYRVLHSGFLGGRSYTFELERLVAARIWDDLPFGPCEDRGLTTYTAGPTAPSSEPGASCSVVPGRDYASGEPCRCNVEARKPTLVNGNQGPPLRTSLECLYELGVAAHLCQPTLHEQRERMLVLEKEAMAHAQLAAEMRQARGTGKPSPAEKTALTQAAFRSDESAACGSTVINWPFQGATAECRYDAAGTLAGLRWGKRYSSEGFGPCPQ